MADCGRKKFVAPDGGWGWVIVAAHGIQFLLVFSIFQSFGLIYKNEFNRLGFTGAQSSFILTTNGGLCMLCGLMNGYLLNKFSVRTVSFCSATFMVSGLIMTAFSTTFLQFLIAYGIVTSIGIGMGMSSYNLAINTYFNERRSKAIAFAITISGVGMSVAPQFASFLLANYTIRDTMLIISAVAGHSFVAASLLQPVEWHRKEDPIEQEEYYEDATLFEQQTNKIGNVKVAGDDFSSIYASMLSLDINNYRKRSIDGSVEKINTEKLPTTKGAFSGIVRIFDLTLLKDSVFVSIIIGLSIEYFSDFNFIWLIPFVLMEKELSIEQTAIFMSTYSFADLCLKFLAPFIASALKQPNRIMFIISLIFVVTSRMFIPFVNNYTILIILAIITGSFRGARLIYWQLVLPDYTPIERLASAIGLLFSLNGLCMILGGPILGIMRDKTGSYTACVILLNGLGIATIILWTSEIVYRKIKGRGNSEHGVVDE